MNDNEFTGIWFPKEVWLDTRLSALEKIILLEIDSLDSNEDGCYASNEYLANFCQCSIRKVSEAVTKLIKLDYIYLESFNGKKRKLRSRLAKTARQDSKNCKAATQNLLQRNIIYNNNNIEFKKEYNKKEIRIADAPEWLKDYKTNINDGVEDL